jgi:hypothetical protein
MPPPTIKRQFQNWHTIPPTADKPPYSIQVNHLATMSFNPFSDRKSNQMYDETDRVGFTILFAVMLIVGGILADRVMQRESDLNYIKQNNCKVKEYDVKTSTNYNKTLWVCSNGKHFVSDYVSQ